MNSVCMATFNGEKYILEQLRSILVQIKVDDELIVSDDGSTDRTLELIGTICDPRVHILAGSPGKGPLKNFETALLAASGDIVFLSDQDDIWLPLKYEKMVTAIRGGADLVLCDCVVVDQDRRVILPSFFAANGSRPGLVKNVIRNSYIGCCMAFNSRLLHKALPIPRSALMHDLWLGLVAEAFYTTVFLYEPMLEYRRHGRNASSTLEKSTNGLFTKLKYRVNVAINLALRASRNTSRGGSARELPRA